MNRKEKTKKKKAEEEEKEKGGGEEEEGTCRLSGGQNGTRTSFSPSTSFFAHSIIRPAPLIRVCVTDAVQLIY